MLDLVILCGGGVVLTGIVIVLLSVVHAAIYGYCLVRGEHEAD